MRDSLLPMMWKPEPELSSPSREQVQEPILRRLRGNFPNTLLKMVETYTKRTDVEWEQLKAILIKEWTSAYEDAVSWDIELLLLNRSL